MCRGVKAEVFILFLFNVYETLEHEKVSNFKALYVDGVGDQVLRRRKSIYIYMILKSQWHQLSGIWICYHHEGDNCAHMYIQSTLSKKKRKPPATFSFIRSRSSI